MWEVLNKIDFSQRTKKGMVEFVQLIRAFKAKAESSDAFVTAQYIAKHSGIVEHLKADKSVEGLSRIENIDSLLDGIKDFVENDVLEINEEISRDKTLSSYLQTISLMTDADESDEAMDSVSMMSIHAAKGLEFKSVFVTGLEENLFPSYQSLSDPNLIDEERRLFYVAITRAEEILTLSFANARYQHGDMRFNDPSRFIEEISENNLDSVVTIQNVNKGFGEPKILGAFKTKPLMSGVPKIDVDGFKASEPGQIKAGQKVLHLKFGEGKVINVDERLVASILFPQVDPNNEKRIMLNFAKLQILED
jgi:DNA helicase-2/ATP-dependent DNA helicase PcrA